jgi:hypothetical protein
MFVLTAARTMARLSATLILLTASFTSFPARADSDYTKVCKIGTDLKALAEDGNANSCRALAIASNLQAYQLGCQSARDENLVMLTTPIKIQEKSARVTSGVPAPLLGQPYFPNSLVPARGLPAANLIEDDEVPPLQRTPVKQTGDIWVCGKHRVGCGNAFDRSFVETLMAGAQAAMVPLSSSPMSAAVSPGQE